MLLNKGLNLLLSPKNTQQVGESLITLYQIKKILNFLKNIKS